MAKTLKVYGFTMWRIEAVPSPNGGRQTRNVVAAYSVAEVLRLSGLTRSGYNLSGCETGNTLELEIAMAEPGVIFWKQPSYDYKSGKDFFIRDDSGLRAQSAGELT